MNNFVTGDDRKEPLWYKEPLVHTVILSGQFWTSLDRINSVLSCSMTFHYVTHCFMLMETFFAKDCFARGFHVLTISLSFFSKQNIKKKTRMLQFSFDWNVLYWLPKRTRDIRRNFCRKLFWRNSQDKMSDWIISTRWGERGWRVLAFSVFGISKIPLGDGCGTARMG